MKSLWYNENIYLCDAPMPQPHGLGRGLSSLIPQNQKKPQEMSAEAYLPHMMRDKKVLAGEMRLVLPLAIGKSEVRGGVSHDVVLGAIADTQQAQQ